MNIARAKTLTEIPTEVLEMIPAYLESFNDLNSLMLTNYRMFSVCKDAIHTPSLNFLGRLKCKVVEDWYAEDMEDTSHMKPTVNFNELFMKMKYKKNPIPKYAPSPDGPPMSTHKKYAGITGVPYLMTEIKGRRLAAWARLSDSNRNELHAAVLEGTRAIYNLAVKATSPITIEEITRRSHVVGNILQPFMDILDAHYQRRDNTTGKCKRSKATIEYYWKFTELFGPRIFTTKNDELSREAEVEVGVGVGVGEEGFDEIIEDWIMHCLVPKGTRYACTESAKLQFQDLHHLMNTLVMLIATELSTNTDGERIATVMPPRPLTSNIRRFTIAILSTGLPAAWGMTMPNNIAVFSMALAASGLPALEYLVAGREKLMELFMSRDWETVLRNVTWDTLPAFGFKCRDWPRLSIWADECSDDDEDGDYIDDDGNLYG